MALNTEACNGLVPTAQTHKGVIKVMETEVRCNAFDVEPRNKPRHKSGWVSVRGLNHSVNNLDSNVKVSDEKYRSSNQLAVHVKQIYTPLYFKFLLRNKSKKFKTRQHSQCT